MSLVGALTEAGIKAAKKTAPFYSAVDEALAAIKRPKGTGAEFYTELTKQAGVKKAELADRKLEQAFKAKGKMTKEEAQQVLKENPPPKLKEKVYDEATAIDEDVLREMVSQEMFGKPYSQISFGSSQHRQISDEVYKRMEMDNGTQYGKYKTPDGENYREILLKLPDEKQRFWAKNGQGVERIFNDPDEASRFAGSNGDARAVDSQTVNRMRNQYYSSHWEDEPNVLAHMRVQDRTGPNGEKILHVEEIQSDWHQAGRKKGYKPDDYIEQSNALEKKFKDLGERRTQLLKQAEDMPTHGAEFTSLMNEAIDITPKLMKLQEQRDNLQKVINYGVPDAPFKKNWHELAMKRLLNYAADNGYDSIAITPGAEQAKRYDLSKQVDELLYKQNPDGTFQLSAQARGRGNMIGQSIPAEKLEDYVGKDVAQKIIDNRGTERNLGGSGSVSQPRDVWGSLSGEGLQVGGEGMKGFYDKILPDYLNTFGKPYGAQVDSIVVPTTKSYWESIDGNPERIETTQQQPLHNFPITPKMRESIKQKGLPLYQQVGIPTAGAGAASQMPEQEEPQYGTGGAIAKMALKAAPAPKAPMIIKPSALTELQKIVQQEKGGYGARRLERAADEVPNLEKLYQEKALREAFTGDNAKALMTMNPADFEKYAAKLFTLEPSQGALPQGSSDDYLNYLRKLQGFRDVPFLEINKREQGTPVVPYISGHEGRHRSRAMTKNDETSSLVRLLPRSEMREPFPRRSQEEYIEALKEELALTGNKVKPENYTNLDSIKVITRPPIDLPDIYAKGGSVKRQVKKADGGAINYNTAPDMSDGGRIIQGAPFKRGGKVKVTTNPDAMFMELSNKKLKRK